MKALGLWTAAAVLFFLALAFGVGCAGAQKPEPPPSVDEASWCYAAVIDGTETIGCAETPAACETSRAAALATASEASEQCYPVRLRLDRPAAP
jgi:hypothetical protein